MELKKIISKGLILGLLFNNVGYSFANTGSLEERYETLEGSSITINNVLEEDNVDIEIEGNTLVNLIKEQNNANIFFHYPLTIGEKYTFIYEFDSNMDCSGFVEEITSWQYIVPYQPVKQGKNRINVAVTIPDGYTGNYGLVLTNRLNGYWSEDVEFTNVKAMVLKGDYTKLKIDNFFEGIKSVGELNDNSLEIKASNKNKISSIEYGNYTIESSHPYYKSYIWTNDMFLNSGKRYTVNLNELGYDGILDKRNVVLFKKDKDRYLDLGRTSSSSFTVESDGIYRISISTISQNDNIIDTDMFNHIKESIQLEENANSTPHVPHQSNQIKIKLLDPLRALPNGVKDRIIKRNGQWVIERNCKEVILNGNSNEIWSRYYNGSQYRDVWQVCMPDVDSYVVLSDKLNYVQSVWDKDEFGISGHYVDSLRNIYIGTPGISTEDEFKRWIEANPIKVIYKLKAPIYEPLNIDLSISLYKDTTYISTNSIIPANMKVVVDRTVNRATEAIELANTNPTPQNIATARMWTNLLKESTKKDEFNNLINNIIDIEDFKIDKQTVSVNMDLYIKSENTLSMSLSTNSIVFDNYSSVSDLEKLDAVDITISSSLPYDLNAYLESSITSANGTNTIEANTLNIRESGTVYKPFINTMDKVILKANSDAGNGNIHKIDLKLSKDTADVADTYRTTVKFEAVQK